MSFSSKAKGEICRTSPGKDCCKLTELAALIQTSETIHLYSKGKIKLKIVTENAFIARRVFMLIKSLYNESAEIIVRKNKKLRKNNSYILHIAKPGLARRMLTDAYILDASNNSEIGLRQVIPAELIKNRCCKKAYLRGAFLGSGSVSNPEKAYHLEFVARSRVYGESLCALLNDFDLGAKIITRKNNYVIYVKEGENIVDLLSIIGAHTALLNFENIRVYKYMRNNINRLVNCETANLSKTVNASIRQIENINYIKENIGLENISPSLRSIAELRLNYPNASLKELGELTSPPLGKSGVNHRLRKLEKIVNDHKSG